MLSGAFGTYAAALIVLASATAIGAGILAAGGRRSWSWSAPAVGLAAATVLAWWTVRLPGHGWTALVALAAASVAAGAFAATRLEGCAGALRRGAPIAALILAGASIPFAVEGHFGVLGSGFNVDMSQHLFAASWIADPTGSPPGLFEQGYPLGPHALAVAAGEVSGNLTAAFSGVTIAIPALAALAALGGLGEWPWWRATLAAGLVAFAYLAASYLAQGAFKELFEVAFLVGFAVWLGELRAASSAGSGGWRVGLPGAVLAAGALYAYSSPGLAWLVGALLAWAAIELVRRPRGSVMGALRAALPAIAAGLAALAILAAPEIDRIVDFGGSVGTVSDSSRAEGPAAGGELLAARGSPAAVAERSTRIPKFDNDLGNLFGQISPLEALNVWPSGDFRVAPGDGAVPAIAFYAGALLGALALIAGLARALRRRELGPLAALLATAAIWLAARIASTPYTSAKALVMLAAIAMLLAVRGILAADFAGPPRGRVPHLRAALAAAFVAAAGLSSGLALANAPVGPGDYTPGVRELSDRFAGRPTLLLVPDDVLSDQHGFEFYEWEIREASPTCVGPESAADPAKPSPGGFAVVLTLDGGGQAPFRGLQEAASADGVTLWSMDRRSFGFLDDAAAAQACRTTIN